MANKEEIAIVNARAEGYDRGFAAGRAQAQQDKGRGAVLTAAGAVSRSDHEAAVASAREEGRKAGLVEGSTKATPAGAAATERTRIKTILTSAEAKDRSEMANHLALETDMSADQATALLARAPRQTPKMDRLDLALRDMNPTVGADAGGGDELRSYERGRQIALRAKGKA